MKRQYNSVLRSEAGLRFYQNFCLARGNLLFEEKLSYVNQYPFDAGSVSTQFVAAASTFPISIGSTKMENLGGAEFKILFLPNNNRPYFSLDLQTELGTSYQSYFAQIELGKNF